MIDTHSISMFDLIDTILLISDSNLKKKIANGKLIDVSLAMFMKYHNCSLLHSKILRLVVFYFTEGELFPAVS